MKVSKAVIPAAGLGTRFLPATRSIPKPMVPVLDRPAIHYTVEEAAQSGIEHVIFVLTHGQEAIGHYFDRLPELEHALERRGDHAILSQMLEISEMAEISYVYQKRQLGPGHAVLAARAAVGDAPFAVLLPDDLLWSDEPTIGRMVELFSQHGSSIVAAREVPDEAVPSLGIIDERPISDDVSKILGMVEKPSLDKAPSNLAIIGRYVLTSEVFDALETVQPGARGEIQLTDGIAMLLPTQGVYAFRFPGVHFDVGTPLGLLKASVYAALRREDLAGDLREWLEGIDGSEKELSRALDSSEKPAR